MTGDDLFLGHDLGDKGRVGLDPDHLTTHAVCVGMTGSGKTGLGIVALEELARRGVPLLVVDLKGDMVDLLLNFPSLDAAEVEPWLTRDQVAGRDRAVVAKEQADIWRQGLARSGLSSDDMREARDGVRWQLLTPGSDAVAPVDILPSMAAPPSAALEGARDRPAERAGGISAALLSLIGRGGDPLTDRDTVLVSSILLDRWTRGVDVDLGGLLAAIADPPMESLGVLPLDRFYPRDDRLRLVTELNALVASPAFRAWTTGVPLTMEALLGNEQAPRASVLSIAHLDDRQRIFFLSLLVSELVAWMRGLPGTGALRVLLYIDEMQGILPPHPATPASKGPLLTVLKQGRAFGVGAWLATQNPVDLDYKALGNAGVTFIGRLVTEHDRERVLDGLDLRSEEGEIDVEGLVASLGSREFVLHDVRAKVRTRTFGSRWAMSYLRGPVTLVEMARLVQPAAGAEPEDGGRPAGGAGLPSQRQGPPVISAPVHQVFAAAADGPVTPSVLVHDRVRVSRRSVALDRTIEEWWQIPLHRDGGLDWSGASSLVEAPHTVASPPTGAAFPAALPGRLDRDLERVKREFIDWRARTPVVVLAHPGMKIAAAAGEDRQAFEARCREVADRADDDVQQRTRDRYRTRMDALQRRLEKERFELEGDRAEARTRKAEEVLGVVEGLFSVLLGSRTVGSAGHKAASRARAAATKRRMSRKAEADVDESVGEISRIEHELEELADEMEAEVDRIAAESEAKARAIEELAIRPTKVDIDPEEILLLWS